MLTRHSIGVATQEIIKLCYSGLNSLEFRKQAIARVRQVIPLDSFWFATADPISLLFTGSLVEGIPESATMLFVSNEFLQPDVNKWTALSAMPIPVNSLYQATNGRPETSVRYRDICRPLGLEDELRAALRSGNRCWGFMCLHRARGGIFRANETEILAHVAPHLAEALRTAALREQSEQSRDYGPGLVILDAEMAVTSATPAGDRWLCEIADWPARGELPQVILAVAAQLSKIESCPDGSIHAPRARVKTKSGQWIVVHASRLSHSEQIAIILEAAAPTELAYLLFEAYGLTRRESDVVRLVLQGYATARISAALTITEETVQQHLKAVFDKLGVHSRRDLVAQIFSRHYRAKMRRHQIG